MRILLTITTLLILPIGLHLYGQDGGLPPTDDKEYSLDKLRKDVATLTEKIKAIEQENKELRKQNIDLAREVIELKQTLKELTSGGTPSTSPPNNTGNTDNPDNAVPDKPIKGTVLVVASTTGKIVIKPGEDGGVKVGYKFNVLKENNKIATIEVERVVDRYSITKLVEGKFEDVKYGQNTEAVLGKIENTPANNVTVNKPPPANKAQEAPVVSGIITEGKYTTYVLNLGKFEGIKVGDKILVQDKDKSGKCYLLVDIVEDDFSLARLDKQLKSTGITVGDNITIEKPQEKGQVGRVRIKNKGLVAIDIGSKAGGKVGLYYSVMRDGKTIAEVVIKETYDDWSLVVPVEGSSDANIQVGDQLKLKTK